ncbi:hypothetical protein, partial [Rhizobium sp. LjRoot98]|uniref:hypothetical protein n=1 Tax=Rhizobium sp. LjRoot98 TaxID=3342345 RepID=UPI003F4FBB01
KDKNYARTQIPLKRGVFAMLTEERLVEHHEVGKLGLCKRASILFGKADPCSILRTRPLPGREAGLPASG